MTGGKIKAIIPRRHEGKYLAFQYLILVEDNHDRQWRVIACGKHYELREGDSIWWQSYWAYWTPYKRQGSDIKIGNCYPSDGPKTPDGALLAWEKV